jgi:iron complex outermembrane receptor protein
MRNFRASHSLILAWAALGAATTALAQSASNVSTIDEVVVTAQKVEQREIDVPVAVSVVSSDTLVSQDLVQVTDYYSRIPGLQVGALPGGANGIGALSLRGITTGGSGNPTLAVLVDDVPFGATTYLGQPPFPDFDAAVLDHIEVLRGPQGTLYGASSLGGLIKFVTKTPDTQEYWAHVEAGPSFVDGGSSGWSGRGAVNLPLIGDYAAILLSGFYRDDPAWIDNSYPTAVQKTNVNTVLTRGGNAKLLIKPTDALTINLSATAQHQDTQNSTAIMVCPQCATTPTTVTNYTPLYGQDTLNLSPATGLSTFEVFSGKITYDFGWAQLTSLSAWNHSEWLSNNDVTFVFGFLPPLYNLPGGTVTIANQNQSSRFTQELRLGATGKQFDWLAGFYFNHENEGIEQILNLFDAGGTPLAGAPPYTGAGPFYYKERAFFGDFTYHVTSQFDMQVGARYSWLDEAYYSITDIVGAASAVFGPTSVTPLTTSSAHPVTWLATPSYHITPDLMTYFRAASGYRPGGPNTGVPGVPPAYAPDKVVSYELGLKGYATQDHKFSFDVAAFQIDWRNIQLLDTDPVSQFTYFSNGSAARSRGVELDATWTPWRGFTFSPNFTYTDAALTQNLPPPSSTVTPLAGLVGDQLPYTSKVAGNISLQQNFVLTGNLSAYVGGNYSYVGSRLSAFETNSPSAPGPRFALPGYGLLDMQGGLILAEDWRLNLYGRNLGDKRGVIAASNRNGTAQPTANFTQPRTIGFEVEYNFRAKKGGQ